MIQFYSPDVELSGLLPETESAHCVRVLRMKEGDEIVVTDGKGKRFRCVILKADPKHTEVTILSQELSESGADSDIILAVAPTKNIDRMEWLLEKSVEIGVGAVVFLKCQRSERQQLNMERLEKIVVSAMKQSLKTVKPTLVGMTDFKTYVKSLDKTTQKFFGYCDDIRERVEFVSCYQPETPAVIMIGPEGDFSPEEVELAEKNGFVPVTFGTSRLRTETAALYGLTAAHVMNKLATHS